MCGRKASGSKGTKKFLARKEVSTISSMRTTDASPIVRLSIFEPLRDFIHEPPQLFEHDGLGRAGSVGPPRPMLQQNRRHGLLFLLELVAQQFPVAHAVVEMPTLLHPLLDVRRVPYFEHDLLASRISARDLQRGERARGYRDPFLLLHDTTAKLFAGRPIERTLPGVTRFP